MLSMAKHKILHLINISSHFTSAIANGGQLLELNLVIAL